MDDLADRIHRTWIEFLLAANMREVAALVADANLRVLYDNWSAYGIGVDLSPSSTLYLADSSKYKQTLESTLQLVSRGHLSDQNGNTIDELKIEFRIRLIDAEENWREVVKELVANAKDPNQGTITEKVFARTNKRPFVYNEMKFASQSEIRIAQEFERRQVLFFPLPLAVRAETGNLFEDHREVDFLVCQDGVWGTLEVAYHPDRYEQDKQKDLWFKRSGILCVEHYTAERCYQESSAVVSEFLSILARYKR